MGVGEVPSLFRGWWGVVIVGLEDAAAQTSFESALALASSSSSLSSRDLDSSDWSFFPASSRSFNHPSVTAASGSVCPVWSVMCSVARRFFALICLAFDRMGLSGYTSHLGYDGNEHRVGI